MEQLIEFSSNHAVLVIAFIAIAGALSWNVFFDPINKDALSPVESTALMNHENAVVLDTRSMAEFKTGHIVDAINIPMNNLGKQLKTMEKHKDQPIIVCCRSGSRSAMACKTLKKAGFEKVHNLKGGIMAWENASLPVKRKS
jgi:rhodanese-related sulfurtransferase